MNAAEAAVIVLAKTDNEAVGYGDAGLLHAIATELGWEHKAWHTESRVLNAIDRHHKGRLLKRYFRSKRNALARVFYLPGCEPHAGPVLL